MIKCGVCGSENEAEALFCGTCGSALTPPDTAAIAKQAEETTALDTASTDDAVVPGKGDARRDLGVGTPMPKPVVTDTPKGGATEPVSPDTESHMTGPTVTCAVCGTINDATRTYCRKCANELKPMAAPPPPPPPKPQGRGISPVLLGVAAAGVVAVVGIAIVLALNGGDPGSSTAPTLAATASNPVVSTATPGASGTPAPSTPVFTEGDPTGQIVFARCEGSSNCVIFLIDADGTEVGALTDVDEVGSATDPDLSYDGTRVVFAVRNGLRLLDIDSGDVEDHSTGRGDTNPAWSPDGSQIAFSGRRERNEGSTDEDRELRLDGVAVTGPSEPLTTNAIEDQDPVFTPDGQSIIWSQGEGNARELKRIDLGSREVVTLTSDTFNDLDPAVSPDGTKLAFAGIRDGGDFDLFLMDLVTLQVTPLPAMPGDEHDPTWSPGGRYIVFSGGDADANDLFILDLADSSIDPLTSTGDRDIQPSWR